jgi:hypothetical protein
LIAFFIILTSNIGCLSPFTITTMGTAGSNAPVAFNVSGRGKGESFWIAKYEDVIAATLGAVKALSLELRDKKMETGQTFFRLCDAKEERIDLLIERRSDTMTSIRFDVGWFGSVAFGRLVARQIIFELEKAGDFLEEWAPTQHN